MAIYVDENTRVAVAGLTGRQGRLHGLRNKAYGTKVVAGVTPGKGGTVVHDDAAGDDVPVYDTMAAAVAEQGANTALIFVPPPAAIDSCFECVDAGIDLIVCITEGIPMQDEARFYSYLKASPAVMIGPNCPGVMSPGKANVGIMPPEVAVPGRVGLVSRSGTLTYQVAHELTQRGIGISTCVGIGGDPVIGEYHVDVLAKFETDAETDAVVLIGEIGGDEEEKAARFVAENMTKPVVGYVAGFEAPPGKKMGHAGAIISGSKGTAQAKAEALESAGVKVGRNPSEIADLVAGLS
jgi:succinyl-CoA synthetase alpha subunit